MSSACRQRLLSPRYRENAKYTKLVAWATGSRATSGREQ
jgi:hypothetical protein